MSPFEFKTQIERLNNVFGERSFPEERSKLLWEAFKECDAEWFRRACNFFIGESRFPPTLSQFKENLSSHNKRNDYVTFDNLEERAVTPVGREAIKTIKKMFNL